MSRLSELCEAVYLQGGQHAVYEYILDKHPNTKWAWCDPCEHRSPRDTDYSCLVCGSPTEPYWGQDGEN